MGFRPRVHSCYPWCHFVFNTANQSVQHQLHLYTNSTKSTTQDGSENKCDTEQDRVVHLQKQTLNGPRNSPLSTHAAMSRYPQEDAAWRGSQPSLSGWLILAPCSTRKVTMSTLSSMHAWKREKLRVRWEYRPSMCTHAYYFRSVWFSVLHLQIVCLEWALQYIW